MVEKLKNLNQNIDSLLSELQRLRKENEELREKNASLETNISTNNGSGLSDVEGIKEQIDKNIAEIDKAIEILNNK